MLQRFRVEARWTLTQVLEAPYLAQGASTLRMGRYLSAWILALEAGSAVEVG